MNPNTPHLSITEFRGLAGKSMPMQFPGQAVRQQLLEITDHEMQSETFAEETSLVRLLATSPCLVAIHAPGSDSKIFFPLLPNHPEIFGMYSHRVNQLSVMALG